MLSLFLTLAHGALLLYTNDILGEIEPCGCRKNPTGGMVRRSVFQESLSKETSDPYHLAVDAGDLLFSSASLPPLLEDQSRVQAEYVIKTLNRLGHNATVPGEKDMALGLDEYLALMKKAKFKVLGANAFKPRTKKRLFQPRVILKTKRKNGRTLRVGVFGLLGDKLSYPPSISIEPPLVAAPKQVAALKKAKVDVIVALTHQGLEADKELAKLVKGIDIIVGGHTQSFIPPRKEGRTWVVQSSYRHQHLGVIPLDELPKLDNHEMVELDDEFEPGKKKSKRTTALIKLVDEGKAAIAKLNNEENETATPEGDRKFQTFVTCVGCHKKQFEFWRGTAHTNALMPLLKPKKQLANKECLQCHTVGLGAPNGFTKVNKLGVLTHEHGSKVVPPLKMVKFLERLHKAKSIEDPKTPNLLVAKGKPTSLENQVGMFSKAWGSIQCENCHGPADDHPFSSSGPTKKVSKTSCLECHNYTRSRHWYNKDKKPNMPLIDKKFISIACPKGTDD